MPKLDEFLTLLPKSVHVSTEDFDRSRHLRDFTLPRAKEHLPLAVVYPRTTEEVADVMKAASQTGMTVVPQGGLTGMAGGAIPSAGCIALSLEKLKGIEEIDTFANTVTVLAGTPLQAVQQAAQEVDRFFAIDFGSRGSCTIGGMLANNAGGNRVLRYGMTRDQVLGLEVVLADGTIVGTMNKMIKNNTGYDLRHLFIGSEGTLGVITRAVFRLFPAPRSAHTILFALDGIDQVHRLLALARGALGAQLSAFEVMWQDFYAVTHAVAGRSPLPPEAGTHFVLLEALGSDEQADAMMVSRFAEQAFEQEIVTDAAQAQSVADAQDLWRIRDSSGELSHLWGRGAVVNFDVSVPIARAQDFVDMCRTQLARDLQAEAVFFGHLADSNMHLAVPDPTRTQREAICRTVYDAVRAMSGAVSAEHGIGLDKRHYLHYSRSEAEISLMRRLKGLLDPQGLLNPGKIFPDAA